jgi:hypothetical protein
MTHLYEIVVENKYHRSEDEDKHNDSSVDDRSWR